MAARPLHATRAASCTAATFSGDRIRHSSAKIGPASTSSPSGMSSCRSAYMPGDMPSTPTLRAEASPGIARRSASSRDGFQVTP